MKIREIESKSIIAKSGLPHADYVINPYVGCMHGCIYCYATFMKRFTNHAEPWGEFLDVKVNAGELVPKKGDKYRDKSITISSVTDAYQPAERKYKLMRSVLTNLIPHQPDLCFITKSDLILRDVDLLKQFECCKVGLSLSQLDDGVRKEIEPLAASVERRINALRELKGAGIGTFVFVSPMLPGFSDWKEIIQRTRDFADEFWFENLNVRTANWPKVVRWLKAKHPERVKKYEQIYFVGDSFWQETEAEIREFCSKEGIDVSIFFHQTPMP